MKNPLRVIALMLLCVVALLANADGPGEFGDNATASRPKDLDVNGRLEIIGTVLTAAAGVILLSIGCAGFFTRPLGWPRRAWTFVAAAFFIMPPLAVLPTVAADAIGLVLGAAFVVSELSTSRPVARARPVEKPS